MTYLGAGSTLDDAEAAADDQEHADLVESARGKRVLAVVLVGGGVALMAAAATRYYLVHRASAHATVGVAPAPGGGLVTWSGRF